MMEILVLQKGSTFFKRGTVNMQGHNSLISLLNTNRFIEFTNNDGTYLINTENLDWVKEA